VRRSSVILAALVLLLGARPAFGHYPVNLKTSHNTVAKSPILLDGTISFAVYADFAKANDKRSVRFALKGGQRLKAEYLILDRTPTSRLRSSSLPVITITSPSGKRIAMKINERTSFYEPYGKKNYFFLSRVSQSAEAGIYSITARAKMKSAVVIAIGQNETRGDFLEAGSDVGQCPVSIENEEMITNSRANQLVSMSELAAEVCAAANSWAYRVAARDGEDFMLTQDYSNTRVTVSIRSGTITKVDVG